jgi:predicted metal-dependent enzyme (double-stranded beta helix superfamily)
MRDEHHFNDLVERLKSAAKSPNPEPQVRIALEHAISKPEELASAATDFLDDEVLVFEDETISIWHCRYHLGHPVPPHDHGMAALIGFYRGSEKNEFFERNTTGRVAKVDSVVFSAGSVAQIPKGAIHSVECVSEKSCVGIHVYLGALSETERSLFDQQTGKEMAFDEQNYERLRQAMT